MSKQKKKAVKPEVEKEADYYKLKTKAVDDLVNANEENSPEVSEAEIRKYRSGHKFKISDRVKVYFIKAWFAGAVCYFFVWGLSPYLASTLDILFVTGMALGIVTDLLTNNVLRFFAKTEGAYDHWIMVTRRGLPSFFLNILYGYVNLFFVYLLYSAVNMTAAAVTGSMDKIFLGVEPICFGIFSLLVDLFLLQIKHFFADHTRRL